MDLELHHPASQSLYDVTLALIGGVAGGIGYNALGTPSTYKSAVFVSLLLVLFITAIFIRLLSPTVSTPDEPRQG